MKKLVKRRCVECGGEHEVYGYGRPLKFYQTPSYWCEECLENLPVPMVRLENGMYATKATERRMSAL